MKVHTPAGKVRIVNLPPPACDQVPFEELSGEENASLADRRWGAEDGPPKEAVNVSSAASIESRLRDEYQAGFHEGRRYAEKTLRAEFEERLKETESRVAALAENLAHQVQEFRAAAERDFVRLALAIAERLVKREVRLDDEFIVRQIQEAMRRVIGVERIRIRLNPADEESVRRHRGELLTSADAVRELTIEADETIPQGSCVLESDGGNVDASIQTQLERIEAALLKDEEVK